MLRGGDGVSVDSTSIKKLYGVGDARAARYKALGIESVGDLLQHYPRGYEDRGDIKLLTEADALQKNAFILTVATQAKSVRIRGRMSLTKFRAYDDSASCEITFFNQEFLKNTFIPGTTFRFYGRVEKKAGRYTMTSPAFDSWSVETELPSLVPLYPLTEGLSQKQLTKDMRSAMVLFDTESADDMLPEDIRRRNSLCSYAYAVKNIHMPSSFSALAAAKKRLIFDEFFGFALGLSLAGVGSKRATAYACAHSDELPLFATLPFEPTEAQRRVVTDIKADMAKDVAMSRMVVGDVGSGKTVCAAAAMLFAVQSGRQAALMAPTEILARQHYDSLKEMLAPLGIGVELLLGAMTQAQKKKVYSALSGESGSPAEIVVGTHALLSEGVRFAALGLVVVDEQHRFGVEQRAALAKKSESCHTLVMSATPIPRSLALGLYGDLDISYIDQMPAGRQVVDTFIVDESYRTRLNGFILKQVQAGGQVYVVCPAVEESDVCEDDTPDLLLEDVSIYDDLLDAAEHTPTPRVPLKSAVAFAASLAEALPTLKVDFMHGKLKSREKEQKMKNFVEGLTDVLVSTTVIEVGVNVPSASLMIVENAERFGLSQLHQLRGRVGRGSKKSYCVLVSDAAPEGSTARARLNILRDSHDGYEIAERDLAMRGPGDFLKSSGRFRQSGGVQFKLAQLCDDTGLMSRALAEAKELLKADPALSSHPLLRASVSRDFSAKAEYLN